LTTDNEKVTTPLVDFGASPLEPESEPPPIETDPGLPPVIESEPVPKVAPAVKVTGKVEEAEMSPGAIAGKDVSTKVHPKLAALIDSGAPAKEIYELAKRTSGSYAAGVRNQLASQFITASELEGEARVEASRALQILPEGFDELPQELKDAYAKGDEAYNTAVGVYNRDIQARQAEEKAVLDKLAPYKTDEGYELRRAFDEGKGADVYEARALGIFTPEQIVEAQLGGIRESELAKIDIKTRDAALSALSEYKTDEGYELSRAFAEGKGALVYDALASGLFTPEQVSESQFASIKIGSEALAEQARVAKFEGLGLADYKVSAFSETKLKEEMKELAGLFDVAEIRKKKGEIAAGVGGDITGYDLAKYFRDYGTDLETIKRIEKDMVAAGFDAKQVQLARVGAFSAPSVISPITKEEFEEGRPGWAGETAMALQSWVTDLSASMSELPTDNYLANLALTAGGAAIVVGATVLTAIPTLALKAIAKPLAAPGMLGAVAIGLGAHIVNTAKNIWVVDDAGEGKYTRDIKEGNLFPLVRDTVISFLVIKGGIKLSKGIVSRVTTYLRPRGVPASVIAKEASTGRIKVSQEQFAKAYADAINKVEQLAMTKGGKFSGTVPIKGTPFELHYLKTPLQQKVGNVLFHGTKDVIDAKGNVITPSALRLAETQGGLIAPKGGIYTSPWAAVSYSRGGQNPGLLMIVTNASKFKSGARGLVRGTTPSDAFIKGSPKGFYGSSKTWRGDLETEIVMASGTKLTAPLPTMTGLLSRMTAGKYADFFTYDAGKYVPIKIAVDTASLGKGAFSTMTPANLYAVKLYSLYGGLRDVAVSLKHPGLVLKDISGTLKELVKLDNWVRSGGKGGLTMPGLRDVYLVTNYGAKLKGIATSLWNEAFRRTKTQLGNKVSVDSAVFRAALERNMSSVYSNNASALISAFKDVSAAYAASEVNRSKFEASYIANLGMSVEALAKSSYLAESSMESSLIDMIKSYPISEAQKTELISRLKSVSEASVASPSSVVSSLRTKEARPISAIVKERPISEGERLTSGVKESPIERSIREVREEPIEPITEELREPRVFEPREPVTEEPITEEPITEEPREPVTEEPIELLPPPSPPEDEEDIRKLIKPATLTWRQGLYWILLPPPYTKRHYSKTPPPGVKKLATGEGSAAKTIQVLGGRPTEDVLGIDIGICIVDIKVKGKELTIHFKQDPSDAYSGKAQTTDQWLFGGQTKNRKSTKRTSEKSKALMPFY